MGKKKKQQQQQQPKKKQCDIPKTHVVILKLFVLLFKILMNIFFGL